MARDPASPCTFAISQRMQVSSGLKKNKKQMNSELMYFGGEITERNAYLKSDEREHSDNRAGTSKAANLCIYARERAVALSSKDFCCLFT